MTYIAEPIQRAELRALAKKIRKLWQVEDRLYIPVITILEKVMPLLFPPFSYEYVPIEDFSDKKHGETDIVNHIVRIREDVYYGAIEGNGRDRMTVMHEIVHYILLVICGVKFERNFDNKDVITYRDPEWQAKALAGEIMCPHDKIKDLSFLDVMIKCGVSEDAAKFNLKLR
ncbi:MAG: hypothetical protein IJQ28_02250 [Clostridia bacterium]|nr:hypothetical protein [Clostridia bacterium]